MPAITPNPVSNPIAVFVRSQYFLPDEEAVDDFLCRYQPVVHTDPEGAVKEARLAAPTDDETPEERLVFLAGALGGIPGVGSVSDYSEHLSYMAELALDHFRIETTSCTDKAAQLREAEAADNEHRPHALWLPADDNWPDHRLRIVANDSLRHRFRLVRSAVIPARLLAP